MGGCDGGYLDQDINLSTKMCIHTSFWILEGWSLDSGMTAWHEALQLFTDFEDLTYFQVLKKAV